MYKRVLLKLSGEALAGEKESIIDPSIASFIASEIAEVAKLGVEIGIVIGGGNIIRGAALTDIPRVSGDSMGMLATTINSIAICEYLRNIGVPSAVLTAVHLDRSGEFFTQERALNYLACKTVVVIAGGTGNPFFTTDTAAALRCAEIGAEVVLKATKVDGIYDSDPMKNPQAKKLTNITHAEALSRGLKVMDSTAFSFCMEQKLPIIVFKLLERGNLRKVIEKQSVGSTVITGG